MNNYLTFEEIKLKLADIQKTSHKCKCGHTVVVANKSGRAECKHCHNLVFKDAKTEFEYRMKRELIKERRNLK